MFDNPPLDFERSRFESVSRASALILKHWLPKRNCRSCREYDGLSYEDVAEYPDSLQLRGKVTILPLPRSEMSLIELPGRHTRLNILVVLTKHRENG